jgi:deoxyribonuclease I
MVIRPEEEVILKKWNREHPVDAEEADRNDVIAQIQGDRNPFIDHPEMVDQIADF